MGAYVNCPVKCFVTAGAVVKAPNKDVFHCIYTHIAFTTAAALTKNIPNIVLFQVFLSSYFNSRCFLSIVVHVVTTLTSSISVRSQSWPEGTASFLLLLCSQMLP